MIELKEDCQTCGRTPGLVRMVNGEVISDALGWTKGESSPCPDCAERGWVPTAQAIETAKQIVDDEFSNRRIDRYIEDPDVWDEAIESIAVGVVVAVLSMGDTK